SFPALRVLTGLGVAAADARLEMLELEALQLFQTSNSSELGIEDPTSPDLAHHDVRRIGEWLMEQPKASRALKASVARTLGARPQQATQTAPGALAVTPASVIAPAQQKAPSPPHSRQLRVFARDPLAGTRLETLSLNEALISVPWEPNLAPGPVGEYLEI